MGAVVFVLVIRLLILISLICCNPNILIIKKWIYLDYIFWASIIAAVTLYLKAAFTDPGVVRNCPASYLPILDSVGALNILPAIRNPQEENIEEFPRDLYSSQGATSHNPDVITKPCTQKPRRTVSKRCRKKNYEELFTETDDEEQDENSESSWKTEQIIADDVTLLKHDDVLSVKRNSCYNNNYALKPNLSFDQDNGLHKPCSPLQFDQANPQKLYKPLHHDKRSHFYPYEQHQLNDEASVEITVLKQQDATESQVEHPTQFSSNFMNRRPKPLWAEEMYSADNKPEMCYQEEIKYHPSNLSLNNEIKSLTKCPHPMYFVRSKMIIPNLPNHSSAAVGTALTTAASVSASVPAAIVRFAASRFSQKTNNFIKKKLAYLPYYDHQKHDYNNKKIDIEKCTPETAAVTEETEFFSLSKKNNQIKQHSVRSFVAGSAGSSEEKNFPVLKPGNTTHTLAVTASQLICRLEVPVPVTDIVVAYSQTLSRSEDGTPHQALVALRFCETCMKFQPLRSKHCSDCQICIRTMDHHCPWLGTCIGEKNRFYFFWYLVAESAELLCALTQAVRALKMTSVPLEPTDSIGTSVGLVLYLSISIILLISFATMVVCLTGYHIFLISTNVTTWENISWNNISYLNDLPENSKSPFSRGFVSNIYVFCCHPFAHRLGRFERYFAPRPSKLPLIGPENEIIWEFDGSTESSCCFSWCLR